MLPCNGSTNDSERWCSDARPHARTTDRRLKGPHEATCAETASKPRDASTTSPAGNSHHESLRAALHGTDVQRRPALGRQHADIAGDIVSCIASGIASGIIAPRTSYRARALHPPHTPRVAGIRASSLVCSWPFAIHLVSHDTLPKPLRHGSRKALEGLVNDIVFDIIRS